MAITYVQYFYATVEAKKFVIVRETMLGIADKFLDDNHIEGVVDVPKHGAEPVCDDAG